MEYVKRSLSTTSGEQTLADSTYGRIFVQLLLENGFTLPSFGGELVLKLGGVEEHLVCEGQRKR